MNKRSILDYWLGLVIFAFPLFFFPWVRNFVPFGKNLFLFLAVSVGLLVWAGTLLAEKKPKVYFSSFDGLLSLFLLLGFFSLFFLPSGVRVRALTQANGLGTFFALTLFSFLLGQSGLRRKPKLVISILSLSAAVAALVSVVLFLLPASIYPIRLFGDPALLTITSPRWSTLGSLLALAIFLVPLFVYWVSDLIVSTQKREGMPDWKAAVFSVALLVGLGVSGYQLLKTKPILLDYPSSWAVTIESFKRHPLLGAGWSNYHTAFSLYRPVEFNLTNAWNLRFGSSTSFILHLWAEVGIIGLALWGIILFKLWRLRKRRRQLGYLVVALILIQLFAPASIGFLFLFFVVLALLRPTKQVALPEWEWSVRGLAGFIVLVVVGLGFSVSRVFWADLKFVDSLRAVAQNRGGDAYQAQTEAVRANRFVADYRIARAQTDLALANSIAAKGETTDNDRQQITLLIQEAINEAKAASALEPQNAFVWENLAQVYRQIINMANGADQWAVAAYQQAMALDPFNPRLRVELGGVFYGFNNFEQAARQFEAAVTLKGDYANGWYNWAWALKQQNRLQEAIQALQQAIAFVDPDTPDYTKALGELEEWKKELGETAQKQPAQPEVLTEPKPLPSPKLEQPIELPKEAAPQIEVTPVPTEEVLPTE